MTDLPHSPPLGPPRPRSSRPGPGGSPRSGAIAAVRSPWVRAALVAALAIALDQLAKHAVRASIARGGERGLLPDVSLVDARNRGVAFGFLPGDPVVVTVVIALALAALLVYFALHTSLPLIWLPTGMLLGGALGNALDRLRAGYVTDFVKLPLGWPPFNLADVSITLGVLILLLVIERPRGERPRSPNGARRDR